MNRKTTLIARVAMVVLALCLGLSAKAINWTAISQGTYQISSNNDVYWTFTPATDCVIVQKGCPDLNWYTTYVADYDMDNNVGFSPYDNSGFGPANEKTFNVKGGTTYYLVCLFPFMDYTVSIAEQQEITMSINSIDPAPGSVLHAGENGAGQVLIFANMNARYESVYLTSGSLTSQVYSANSEIAASTPAGINIREALVELYDKGLQAGAPIVVHINGLRDKGTTLYNGDGKYEISYVSAPAPIDVTDWGHYTMTSTGLQTRKFFSYYPAGDPEAIYTFTFSGNIKPTSVYSYTDADGYTHSYTGPVLEIGCTTDNDAYFEYYEGKVSGNKVTFDLSGHNFGNFDGKLGADSPPSFKLFNVYDLSDQIALGMGEGNAGSYDLPITYCEYQQANSFDQTWTPAQSMTSATNLTVTFSANIDDQTGNYNRIASFAGVQFTFEDAAGVHTTTVPFAQCTLTNSGRSTTVTCPIPAGYATANNVRVNLTGIVSTDGFNYSDDVIANIFNMASSADMLRFNPAPGSSMPALEGFDVLTSATFQNLYPTVMVNGVNHAPAFIPAPSDGKMHIYLNPAVSVDGSTGNRVSEGTKVEVTFPANAFYEAGAYSPETTFVYTISKNATTPEDPQTPDPQDPDPEDPQTPEVGTPFTLVSSPVAGSTVNIISAITLASSGVTLAVNEDATGAITITKDGAPVEHYVSVSNGSATISLTSPATAPGTYTVSVPAEYFVYTTATTIRYNSAFTASFTIREQAPSSSVLKFLDPDGSSIDRFARVYLTNTETIGIADASKAPYVEGYTNKVFYSTFDKAFAFRPAGSLFGEYAFTDLGTYTLVIPAGYLKVGGTTLDTETRVTYTVAGPSHELTVSPDPSARQESIAQITVSDANLFALSYATSDSPTLNGQPVTFYSTNYGEASAIFAADVDITANGQYELYIPAGYFSYNTGFENQMHKALNVTFYVGEEPPTSDPEEPFSASVIAPVALQEGGSYASTGVGEFIFDLKGVSADSFVSYRLTCDIPDEEWINQGLLYINEDAQWAGSNINWKLYDGVNYTMTVALFETDEDRMQWFNPISEVEIHFTGSSPAFSYSDVKFVSITPAPDSTIEVADNTITVKWDGDVRVNTAKSGSNLGQGAGIRPFASATCNVPGMNYGSEWTLIIDPEYLATVANIDLVIYATDEFGKVVKGNMDLKELDYYSVSYAVNSGVDCKSVTVTPADGATVGRLREIIVANDELAVSRDLNMADDEAYIIAPDNSRITFDYANVVLADEGSERYVAHLGLNTPIVADGEYTLVIPRGYFIVGAELDMYKNLEVQSTFHVSIAARADVDNSGEVDMSDIAALIQVIIGNTENDGSCDVNCDGEVDMSDITVVINAIIGVL